MELPTLRDGDLVLRPKRPEDADALTAACQDPEIPRWTFVPSPYTRADAEALPRPQRRGGGGRHARSICSPSTRRRRPPARLVQPDGARPRARLRRDRLLGGRRGARPRRSPRAPSRLLADWARDELGAHAHRHPARTRTTRPRGAWPRRPASATPASSSARRARGSRKPIYAVYVWEAHRASSPVVARWQYPASHGRRAHLLRRQHRAAPAPELLPGRDRARARDGRLRDRDAGARQRVAGTARRTPRAQHPSPPT